jgi:hypothetical protein
VTLLVYLVAETGRSVYVYVDVFPVAIDGRNSVVVHSAPSRTSA